MQSSTCTLSVARPSSTTSLLTIVALFTLACAAYGWRAYLRSTEVAQLPEVERRAFYQRTLETVRTVCATPVGPDLAEHCQAQAELLLRFPECDASCRDLALHYGPRATR